MTAINIYHFMPDKLNLYGDIGNIIALSKERNGAALMSMSQM